MRVQYASDLHLEFPDNKFEMIDLPLRPEAEILLLAGDILPFKLMDGYNWFFDYLSTNFKLTYWIPGNHEYYHDALDRKCGSFCAKIRDNIFLVNDQAISIGDVRFIFSTLWTAISASRRASIERGMNDFRLIRYNGALLTAAAYNQLHKNSLKFITAELKKEAVLKKVVMTHHVPTLRYYPPEYIGSVLNQGFAVDLDGLIEEAGPEVWLYGHHHRNIPEFTVGKTRLLTN